MAFLSSHLGLILALLVIVGCSIALLVLVNRKRTEDARQAKKNAKDSPAKKTERNFRKPRERFSIVAQYCATMDEETCPLCRFLDGRIIEMDHPDFREFSPQLHPHLPGRTHGKCRCFWTYLSKKEEPRPVVNWVRPPQELILRYFKKK